MKLDDTIILGEEEMSERQSNHTNSALIRNIALILLTLLGTLTGVLGAITVAVNEMWDVTSESEEELNYILEHYYTRTAKFASTTAQADFVSKNVVFIILAAAAFLAALVVCTIHNTRVARGENGEYTLNGWDRIWSEVHIVLMIIAIGLAIYAADPIFRLIQYSNWIGIMRPITVDKYLFGISNTTAMALAVAGMAACIAVAAFCFSALTRKIAAKRLIRNSLLGKILRFLGIGAKYAGTGANVAGRSIAKAVRAARIPADADRKAAIKLIAIYSLVMMVLIMFPFLVFMATYDELYMLFACIISIVLGIVLVVRKVGKLAEIRAGIIQVRSGNLDYKINVSRDENGPKSDLDAAADDINKISEAVNIAVQNEVKNQRLKTDLISNVSHDLKTPLTSMISYLDILEKEGLDSPDAPQHLAIVQEKTQRLKTLTEELFEAAKASSGNIPCEIADIDINALIDQSLAEMGDKLENKDLDIRKNIKTDNTLVRADGKLLYRVLENLLGNISKYALEGSRVYIDVKSHNGKTLMEIKNISKDELNISADELMERFTRGDSSRNSEGSGLGLAIAKDLTRNMGGIFNVDIDGDMFKASVLLDEA